MWLKEKNVEMVFILLIENVFYLIGFYMDLYECLFGLFVFNEVELMLVCLLMEVG